MNERILKLSMQACRHADYEHQNVPKELVEKFSELIVGECFYCVEIMEKIAHASNADIPPDYDQHTYLKTLEAVTGLMKAHFGVEL